MWDVIRCDAGDEQGNVEVKRAARVRVKALGIDGEEFEIEAEGLPAICMQHEIDHLDGIVFIDRVSGLKRRIALREYRKLQLQAQYAAAD